MDIQIYKLVINITNANKLIRTIFLQVPLFLEFIKVFIQWAYLNLINWLIIVFLIQWAYLNLINWLIIVFLILK